MWASFPQTHTSDFYSDIPALEADLFGHSMAELPDMDNLLLTTFEGVLTTEAQLLCDVALMLTYTGCRQRQQHACAPSHPRDPGLERRGASPVIQ